jgi:hypothetical protein
MAVCVHLFMQIKTMASIGLLALESVTGGSILDQLANVINSSSTTT